MLKRKDAIIKTDKTLRLMRCFEECIQALATVSASDESECVTSKPFPLAVAYRRAKVYFKIEPNTNVLSSSSAVNASNAATLAGIDSNIYLFEKPLDDNLAYQNTLNNFEYLNSEHVLDKLSIEYMVYNSTVRINNLGKWILITKIKKTNDKNKANVLKPPLWLLEHRYSEEEENFKLEDAAEGSLSPSEWLQNHNKEWLAYVDACYNLISDINSANEKFKPNLELMKQLCQVPPNWSIEFDEDLSELIKEHANTDSSGSIKNLVKNVTVSTQRTPEDTDYLQSLDRRTYWESDLYSSNYNGFNSIKLFLKPFKKIKRLIIVVNKIYRQYMPKDVTVIGGDSPDEVTELNKLTLKPYEDGDITILENCKKPYNFIEIQIKTCQRNGTNCRIYGVKIFTNSESNEQIPVGIFLNDNLKKIFPRLCNFDPTFLYTRAELILRFIKLFELCIDAMLPSWTYGEYFQNLVKRVKKILILSPRRLLLIERILNSVPTTHCYFPLIYIDRPLAFAYRGKFNLDPNYQNTIFMQIYNNLSRNYSFRWDKSVEQWWECKFIGEGIIDQGGGFRDSLSDIAEELCPNTGLDSPIPLPFFIRSPNQLQSDLNTFKDTFIVNPACNMHEEYEFVGKLMGACLRSKETLALFLAPFFWKKLSGEHLSWKNDFVTVDSSQVKFLDAIEKANKEDYEFKYGSEITWSCTLSDGTLHKLKPNGSQIPVIYEERIYYVKQVKQVRLSESDKQIDAIRRGLQSVISKHIFCLLTWSEFEFKICGAPKITVDDLKMSIEYEEDISSVSERVKYFWEAISNFSNEERSKFIRFVTGRKRLPVKIFFCSSDLPPTSFPDSSTCNCSIYFPNYPNAQVAEEKLRYAIQNCVAIDTDCSSYEDL